MNPVRELFTEKTRMVLTILAIAWGTFAITSMLAIGEGLRLTFAKAVAGVGSNLLTVTAGATAKTYHGIAANIGLSLERKDLTAIGHLAHIVNLSPQYNFIPRLYYNHQSNVAQVQAVPPIFARMRHIELQPPGRFISSADLLYRNDVMVLGSKTATALFPRQNPLGKQVMIGVRPFTVIGVAVKKPELVAIDTPDEYLNWMPFSTYELLANPKAVDAMIIEYDHPKFVPQLKEEIRKIIAVHHGVSPGDTAIVDFNDITKRQKTITDFFVGLQIFLGIVGGLTLLVAGIGIANVMYAAVTSATHEIGVRKALGATTGRILRHYIGESLIVTFIGGAIGIVLSVIFVVLMRLIPLHAEIFSDIGKPLPVLSVLVMAVVIVVLGAFGLLAGIFPALQAARIDPAEALIYE